jgi:hypothetical protein
MGSTMMPRERNIKEYSNQCWGSVLVRIRIRIPGSVPLTNGSDLFIHWFYFKDAKKIFCIHIFLITCQQAHHLQSKKINSLLKFCIKILFFRHYFSPLNTSMRKGKDRIRFRSDLTNGSGSGRPKGSGSPTLVLMVEEAYLNVVFHYCSQKVYCTVTYRLDLYYTRFT